jgi:hypothetical protein
VFRDLFASGVFLAYRRYDRWFVVPQSIVDLWAEGDPVTYVRYGHPIFEPFDKRVRLDSQTHVEQLRSLPREFREMFTLILLNGGHVRMSVPADDLAKKECWWFDVSFPVAS